jgi:hypothetical protein
MLLSRGQWSRIFERPRFSTELFSQRKGHNPFADKRFCLPKTVGTEPDAIFRNETQQKKQSKPMDRIITLHEYRLRYPDSAAIPTLTQSGLLGLLLYRQELRAAGLARCRAMWRRVCAAPGNVFRSIWRALTARHTAGRVDVVN